MVSTTIWFIAGTAGSTHTFQKILNVACHDARSAKRPDYIILAGDLLGSEPALIYPSTRGRTAVKFRGETTRWRNEEALRAHLAEIEMVYGAYPIKVADGSANVVIDDARRLARFGDWMNRADRLRLTQPRVRQFFLVPGPSDPDCTMPLLASPLDMCDEQVVPLNDGLTLVSVGASVWNAEQNAPTLPRLYASEDALENRLIELLQQVPNPQACILNVHVPPAGSHAAARSARDEHGVVSLDGAAELSWGYGGSTAVRKCIAKFQPVVSLHSRGNALQSHEMIGNTRVINPGSEAAEGFVRGVWLEFDDAKLVRWDFTRELLPRDSLGRYLDRSEDFGAQWLNSKIKAVQALLGLRDSQ